MAPVWPEHDHPARRGGSRGALALTEAAASERYDEARGTSGGFVKMAVLRARCGGTASRRRSTPWSKRCAAREPSRESQEGEALRAWAIRNPKQAETLAEYTDGGNVSPAAESAILALRKETRDQLVCSARASRRTHGGEAAGHQRAPHPCSRRQWAAHWPRSLGQWKILTTSCAAYRERRVVAEAQSGSLRSGLPRLPRTHR